MFNFKQFGNNQLAVSNFKINITNILVVVSFLISSVFTLFFFFVLNNPIVAILNVVLALASGFTLVFIYFNATVYARVWFILVVCIQYWVCTNLYFAKEAGMSLLFFTVPICIFLIFELKQYKYKVPLILLSIFLLIQSENHINVNPMLVLTADQNRLMYQFVIYSLMVIIIATIFLFSQLMAKSEENLIKQATIDNLTKLAHRNYFIDQSRVLLALAIKQQRPFSMMVINIDNLKDINESFGYLVGDEYLQNISKNISKIFDESAIVARFGGKEFIVAMPERTIEEARKKANKINITLGELTNFDKKWRKFRCSASIGITTKSTDNPDIKELIAKANTAVHIAKSKGPGRISVYSLEDLKS